MKNKSYLVETDTDISSDIISRKEFLIFKRSVELSRLADALQESNDALHIIPKFLISQNIPESNYLELRSYQMLTRNYLNPNTPYSRLLLKWETGHGKTIAAISIAMNFIDYYKKQEETDIGSVYIIGFTQTIFKDELLKYPEFGFITRDELTQLNVLKRVSHSGNISSIENLRKFTTNLRKRLYNRKNNGFFKFIGYKELANHLFIYNADKIDLTIINENEISNLIATGKLKINKKLLEEFANSLIICDEIHNVYNTREKNNWGIALQTILNRHKSCRALFLSATPLNNSPTEIIDLLNLLLPREYYASLNKADFFDTTDKIQTLKKSKEVELTNYLKGRVSYIRDRNPAFISTKKMLGVAVPGIEYLTFIRCPMSKFHYNTYKVVEAENKDTLGQDGQYLIDYLIPDPEVKDAYKSKQLGLYKPRDIKTKINAAPKAWQEKNGINYNETDEIISGSVLKQNTISTISAKYSTMVNTIMHNITHARGKMFIYHNYIHMTGTLFIQEILLQNNILSEFGNSTPNTLCICGRAQKNHSTSEMQINTVHYFQPVRFTIVHSNLEKTQISRSLEKFNNATNITGSQLMILVGSKIMKEAHSINSVRNIIVMSRPDNISSLIQIIGRAIRLNSHKLLPAKQQHVDISILVSSVPGLKTLSYEEVKYKTKVETFKVIQQIEKLMHVNAIDTYFNYDTIWESNTHEQFGLDILPYTNNTFKPHELNLSTFNAYHAKFEVDYFITIIKRLFIETSSVWTYKDLYTAVKYPPFSIEINPLITQDIFNIALNTILYNKSITYVEPSITNLSDELIAINLIDKIQNSDDKILVIIDTIPYVITHIGELYTLVSLYNEDIFVDTESVYRNIQLENIQSIDVLQYLQHESISYESKKIKFINKWKFTELLNLESALCDFGIMFHITLAEDIIVYVFSIFTQSNKKKDENHTFYLKMLYFYDLYQLIAWANMLDTTLEVKYAQYVTPVTIQLDNKNVNVQDSESKQLITTLNRSNKEWITTGLQKEYNNNLNASEKLFDTVYQKTKNPKKVLANLLPVGHYFKHIARFYLPSGWFNYTPAQQIIKENDIIIGIDQRSSTGIIIKFKLRSPMHHVQNYADSRLVEKGVACNSKTKLELKQIAKSLNIDTTNITNTEDFCTQIRKRLIYLELKEKGKEHPLKYFYNVIAFAI